ncbi:putative RNA-binding protein Luc7-like 2 isoform 1-T1 [Macrochelys suwanniensis]
MKIELKCFQLSNMQQMGSMTWGLQASVKVMLHVGNVYLYDWFFQVSNHLIHFFALYLPCPTRSKGMLCIHEESNGRNGRWCSVEALRDTTRQRIKFSDDRVCKSHLLNCCPHDVLSGTRMDLGECLKVHDLALRADYEIASKEQDFFFELDAMDHLQSFIADCDRRTEVAKKRLAETQEEISAEVAAKAERVHELNEEIGKLLAKVEQLGADGNVEESQKVMDEVEKARAKKREAEEVYRNSMPASSFQQQKLRVCEVCSAYLGLHDNDRRLADHFGGKLHLGFIEIREKLEELRRVVADKQEKRNQERLKRREEREKEEREKLRRSRSHSKNPRRSRSRDRRRHRSRSASRERKRRTRSKSREKRHRHRSRSSSRSRSHSHQRSRHSSRDRSRERKKRYTHSVLCMAVSQGEGVFPSDAPSNLAAQHQVCKIQIMRSERLRTDTWMRDSLQM